MRPSAYISEHIRRNVVGYIALFCFAIGGFAQALPGKNKVDSGDIKKGQVKRSDVAPNAVDSSKVLDDSLTGADIAGDSVTGADVDESSLSITVPTVPTTLPPSGTAGGDLSGSYPNPEVLESGLIPGGDLGGTLGAAIIANNSIGLNEPTAGANDEITDGGVDSEDVQNSSLTTNDVLNDTLTATDIADTDTINDAEINDRTRSILIPASSIGTAANLGDAPNEAEPGFAATSKAPAMRFDPNTPEGLNLIAQVPDDRVAGTTMGVTLHWSSTLAGTVFWQVESIARGNNSASNLAPGNESAFTDTVAANQVSVSVNSALAASLTNGDMLFLRISRVAADPDNDDLNADAFLHLVELTYTAER